MESDRAAWLDSLRMTAQGGRGRLFRYALPASFYPLAGRLARWFWAAAFAMCSVGLFVALFVSPPDPLLGESYRIMFIHLPAVWMSLFIYLVMVFWGAVALLLGTRLSSMMASALAPTGALFTFVALCSGALWGRPNWGIWWLWDARLATEILLLLLYLAVIALQASMRDARRADRACALTGLFGLVGLAAVYLGVDVWADAPGATAPGWPWSPSSVSGLPVGMLTMTLGFWSYTIAVSLYRVRVIVLERERPTRSRLQRLEGAGA